MLVYTTTKCAAKQPKRRRRIGQMPERLKLELQAMDKHERVRMSIAVGMAMIAIFNCDGSKADMVTLLNR